MNIIMISGKAQSGKDVCAGLFKKELEKYNKKVLIIKFGDLLKFYCREYFDWDGNKDEYGRSLLQHVGTDIVRSQVESFWADRVSDFIKLFYDKYDVVLIPDTRYPNEINTMIKDFPGDKINTVYIDRYHYINGLTEKQLEHSSEKSLLKEEFDFYITNIDYVEFERNCKIIIHSMVNI